MARAVASVLLGAAVYVLLTFAEYWLVKYLSPSGAYSLALGYSQLAVKAISAVIPGFVAVWLYGRHGFWVGAAAGALGMLAAYAVAILGLGLPLVARGLGLPVGALALAFTNAMGGAAAELLRSRKVPSNSTIERDARESGARPSL
jgi:hypothetical protein